MIPQPDSVVIRLMGGLGNQMFQYALGCRLESETGRPVRFDLQSGFQKDVYMRRPALELFHTRVQSAEENAIPLGMNWPKPWSKLMQIAWSMVPKGRRRVVYERRPFRFDETILSRRRTPSYYFGYWQNPEYFCSVGDRLRRDFSLCGPPRPAVSALLSEVSKCRAVSLHVRLYLDIGRDGKVIQMAREHHGACPADYYERALTHVGTGSETVCYVFSDRPDLARKTLKLPVRCRYVADVARFSDVEEMMLMSACHHHVISNSSFSWWGAWLGTNPEKKVVAPRKWVCGLSPDEVQVCPKDWIRIS